MEKSSLGAALWIHALITYLKKVKMAFVEVAAHENVHQVWPLNQYFGWLLKSQ